MFSDSLQKCIRFGACQKGGGLHTSALLNLSLALTPQQRSTQDTHLYLIHWHKKRKEKKKWEFLCRSWFSLRFSLLKTLPTVRCTFLRGHGRGRDTTHGERNSCLLSFSKQQGACSTLWPPRSLLTYAVHTQLTEVIKPSYATVTQFPIKYWVLYLKSEHVQNIFIFRVNDHFRELHYLRGLLQKNKCKSVILG